MNLCGLLGNRALNVAFDRIVLRSVNLRVGAEVYVIDVE